MSNIITIFDLAAMLKGRIVGNYSEEFVINGTCSIDNYISHKVTFVKNKKYASKLGALQNAIVLITDEFTDLCATYPQNVFIIVADVLKAMVDLQNLFYPSDRNIEKIRNSSHNPMITQGADVFIGQNVYLGERMSIGSGTKVMSNSNLFDDVTIGEGTIIEPQVTIYQGCRIGNDCMIHSGARIGADGHRFLQDVKQQTIHKMNHAGYVIVGNRVEIGCNSTIGRSTFENNPTIISDDVKISHQVDIGHNVKIGARTTIAPQSCISGSVNVGNDVWIGVGVSVSNDVVIGNEAKILLNAVVAYDVPEKEIVSGFYAMPHKQWKQVYQKLKES